MCPLRDGIRVASKNFLPKDCITRANKVELPIADFKSEIGNHSDSNEQKLMWEIPVDNAAGLKK